MTAVRTQMTEVTRMPARQAHVTEWVLGTLGALAAVVGTWMYLVPTDWLLGGLGEAWYFGMFIAAGILLTAAFGLLAMSNFAKDEAWTTKVVVPAVLAIAALGGAITFALILAL